MRQKLSLLDVEARDFEPGDALTILPQGVDAGNWCWAACIAMLASWKQVPLDQCQIAQKLFKDEDVDCCSDLASCAKPCPVNALAGLARDCGLTCADSFEGKLELTELQKEIGNDHAIIAAFEEDGPTNHAVIIAGWTGDDQLIVLDPSRSGFPTYPYHLLERALGRWVLTWIVT